MIVLLAGLAVPASAGAPTSEVPVIGSPIHDGPRRLTGHLYFNTATRESVFTPAREYLANRANRSFRALGDDINGDGTSDLWINTNTDPCPIGTPTDPKIELGILDGDASDVFGYPSISYGDHHLFKSQIVDGGSDLLVERVTFTFWTDLPDTDTDSDTVPDANTAGVGIELSFWDREDFFGKTYCFCPQAGGPGFTRRHITTLSVAGLPGTLTPGELAGTVITLELAPDQVFEIADSDGVGPPSGLFNSMIAAIDTDTNSDTVPDITAADTNQNGQIDWSYSLRGIQPTDGRQATIAYTLAAPGVPGTPGVIDGTTGDPVSGPVGADDGVIDYGNRDDGTPPLQWSQTRVLLSSIVAPMGRSGLPFTSGLLPVPSTIARYSLFLASLEEQPDPFGPPPLTPSDCAGLPNSDFFGWGAVHPPDGVFYGDLNCEIDDDGDTLPDGRPWSAPFLALSGGPAFAKCTIADCDCNSTLNVDDIDCFVTAFLSGDLSKADCDGNVILNIDDIDCFVASFIGGCPP